MQGNNVGLAEALDPRAKATFSGPHRRWAIECKCQTIIVTL